MLTIRLKNMLYYYFSTYNKCVTNCRVHFRVTSHVMGSHACRAHKIWCISSIGCTPPRSGDTTIDGGGGTPVETFPVSI